MNFDDLRRELHAPRGHGGARLRQGFVPASARVSFLAERPLYLPEPPHALSFAVDLEDFVAEFAVGIQALRTADPTLDLVFE